MSFILPTNAGQLLGLGNKMVHGLAVDGTALKITQISAADLQADVTAFAAADNAYNAGRSAQQAVGSAWQEAQRAVTGWLGVVRTVLAGRFGQRWSTVWAQAGFINNTTALPSRIEDRIALAGRVSAFFSNNPGYEVPSMQVTAAQGALLLSAAVSAQNAVMAAGVAQKTLDAAWTDAFQTLTNAMWSLIKILQATLADADPRWLDFGLQLPGTPSTPGKPLNVTAHSDQTGAIIVACDPVPLATRYRWRMRLLDLQQDYQLVARSAAPLGSIPGVQPGQPVQIIVQAVNGILQGVASEPIVFTIPVAATEKTLPELRRAAETPEPERGHGNGSRLANGNGHTLHPRRV